MWMNVVVLFVLVVIVLATNSQGFFTNILQLGSTLVAGAIAFACWEPIYYVAIAEADKPFLYDVGWGVALLLTFALARVLLLVLSDKACPANVFLTDQPNWIGGGVVGAANAIVITGILVIGIQFIQGPKQLLGYQAWRLDTDGSIRREDRLWVPVDEIVEFIYSKGSLGSMYAPYPLAELQPRIAQQASLYRISYGDGASRMGMRPDGVLAQRAIRLQLPNPAQYIGELPGVTDPRTGQRMTNGDVYSIITEINNATWDGGDKLRLSKAQIRLVVRMPDGSFEPIHPHAFYQKHAPDQAGMWPFYFEIDEVFATSVGTGAGTVMGFEFLAPTNAVPRYLIVRNMRAEVPRQIEDVSHSDLLRQIIAGNLL